MARTPKPKVTTRGMDRGVDAKREARKIESAIRAFEKKSKDPLLALAEADGGFESTYAGFLGAIDRLREGLKETVEYLNESLE